MQTASIKINRYFCSFIAALVLTMARMASAQTTIPVDQWGAMQVVAAAFPSRTILYYPFTGSATLPLSVTCQLQPSFSGYSPGAYEAGWVSPGYISLDMGDGYADGEAVFENMKPYAAAWDPAYDKVFLSNEGAVIFNPADGIFTAGGLYTIKFTWNRSAATIQIDVTGPTSCSTTVSSNGRNIVRLTFHGPDDVSLGSSSFGNVSVEVPAPSSPPALVFGGLQTLAGTNVVSLTWTNNGAACVLESSDALTGGWSTVSTPWATNGNWVGTQVTNNSSAQFFRLRGL